MKTEKWILFASFASIFFAILTTLSLASPPGGPVGGVGIIIHGTNGTQTTSCGNIDTSCGIYPNCIDTTALRYCVNGKVVESYCFANSIRNRTRVTSCQDIRIPLDFKITNSAGTDGSANIDIYDSDTGGSLGSLAISGEKSMNSTKSVVDMSFRSDDDNFKFDMRRLNLTNIVTQPILLRFDIVNPEISNYNVIRAYKVELPSNFSYSSIKLYLRYDSGEVSNSSALAVFKCSNYDVDEEQCNGDWLKITSTTYQANNTVTADITGFSAYALSEPASASTTQNTNQNTSNQSTTQSTTTSTSSSVSSISSSSSSPPASSAAPVESNPPVEQTTENTTATNPPTQETEQTQTTTTTQQMNDVQKTQKTSGAFVMPFDGVQIAAMLTGIPAVALLVFMLVKRRPVKSLGNSRSYMSNYKRRRSQIKRSKPVSGETKLILQ